MSAGEALNAKAQDYEVLAASEVERAPLGDTSSTKQSRFVMPSSTVIEANCLCSGRRGSRATLSLGSSTDMTIIRLVKQVLLDRSWIQQVASLWGIP